MKRSINAFRKTWLSRRNHWLDKRIPAENESRFNLTNTFILPSSFGWAMIAIVVFLFILGTNYQNNIVLGMSYFTSALLILSLFHSYRYFTQHTLVFMPFTPEFDNRDILLRCELKSTQQYTGGEFILSAHKRSVESPLDSEAEATPISLHLPPFKRGLHMSPRIKVECFFGFGLFRCWSYLQPKHKILVYPSAQKSSINLHQINKDDNDVPSQASAKQQSDNLQGIRNFVETDPLHHVSWKHVAKGQGMLTKDFGETSGVSGWLRLNDVMQGNLEESLRIMSYQVQHLSQEQVEFGFDLGTNQILPQSGMGHLQNCLFQLATYGQSHQMDRRKNDE
ncbi:DUF58 domain-containing protein [Glaciecola siphonariae]|uniref:DUF58 domain-containing protein n=1 Tax=Glaciecola siphonariae TaxID=521012 RepID=A0ABV9LUF1_9ALTE